MRRWVILTGMVLAVAGTGIISAEPVADGLAKLAGARRAAAEAAARAAALSAEAAQENVATKRAARDERASAARVVAAEALLNAAQLRVLLVNRSLAERRERLRGQQQPTARLLAALTSLARRPAIAAIAQPGSIDDLVHIRAVLGATLPIVQERTRGLRDEIARTRALRKESITASSALRADRKALQTARAHFAELVATHGARSRALSKDALSVSDQALAMGEVARDLVDQMVVADQRKATAAELAALTGPVLGSRDDMIMQPPSGDAYRLPVTGRLITGLDELSPNGVRSRGLTFAAGQKMVVVAPAGGTVRFAGPFRSYRAIVIIDHGDGWTTLLSGLSDVRVRAGQHIRAGMTVGRTGDGTEQMITVELRRDGKPQDIVALLG